MDAFGQKVNEEMAKVDGSFARLDKSFRRQFDEVGFKLEEIARSEAVIAKMREENREMEGVIEEYKRREGEFEELKKTVEGYKRNSEEAMKMAQEIAMKFKEIQERDRKK